MPAFTGAIIIGTASVIATPFILNELNQLFGTEPEGPNTFELVTGAGVLFLAGVGAFATFQAIRGP